MGLYNIDNRFWQYFNKLADVFMISLLWLLLCIPVVTAGAATTACVRIVMELYEDAEGSIFRDYWKEFRRCFRRATACWLLLLPALLLTLWSLETCIALWQTYGSYVGAFLLPVIAVLLLLLFLTGLYLWPLLAYTDEPLIGVFDLAFKAMLGQFFFSLSMLALIAIAAVLFLYYPAFSILFPCIILYENAKLFCRAFDRDTRLRPALREDRIRWHLVQFETG